jgi:membrane-bound lytic murein transglycosylase A
MTTLSVNIFPVCNSLKIVTFFVLLALAGCVTVPPRPPAPPAPPAVKRFSSLVKLSPAAWPTLADDCDKDSLRLAALQSAAYYRGLPADRLFILGNDTYTAKDLAVSVESLVHLLDGSSEPQGWIHALPETFELYQSVGSDADRQVTFSSYYEPTVRVKLQPDEHYRYPLYARPPDLIDVDLGLFDSAYEGARVAGRREGKNLVPYSTRADIDSRRVLKGQNLELSWAKNPLDVLDLQIEGSGWLDFGNNDVRRIRYDGTNGRHYRSVGQYLIDSGRLPAKRFSRKTFRQYLARHPKEEQTLLNVNERYVFFRLDTSSAAAYAYGNIEVPLTPGRSIATDPKLFPKGALAWISIGDVGAAGWPPGHRDSSDLRVASRRPLHFQRFVLNQDEGGAIQGPGRVDIFVGHGKDAEDFATHLWHKGKLYFLVKKREM